MPSGPTKWHGPEPGTMPSTTSRRARAVGFTTTVAPAGASTSLAERVQCVADEPVADLARFLVAHEHVIDDLVVAARARRVVRAVEDDVAPRDDRGTSAGTARRGMKQRAHRLGLPLERTLGRRARLVHVDAVRRDTHEQVGARARAQLAGDGRQPFARLLRRGTPASDVTTKW